MEPGSYRRVTRGSTSVTESDTATVSSKKKVPKKPVRRPKVKVLKGTRGFETCPIIGIAKPFDRRQLPTCQDVLRHYAWVRFEKLKQGTKEELSREEIPDIVASDLESVWKDASIPTTTHRNNVLKIVSWSLKYRNLVKNIGRKKSSKTEQEKQDKFTENSRKLFDIASCKCADIFNCACPKSSEDKVPVREKEFLVDQRTTRKMYVGSVDLVTTKMLERKEKRLSRVDRLKQCVKSSDVTNVLGGYDSSSSQSEADNSPQEDDSFTPKYHQVPRERKKSPLTQGRIKLDVTARVLDRTGVSSRKAALIVSSALQEIKEQTGIPVDIVVDRNKLQRDRKRARSELREKQLSDITELRGLYFDGRKDDTLQNNNTTKKEKHIVLIEEPGSTYIGHVSPKSGKSKDVTTSIQDYLHSNNVSLSILDAAGCDGTLVNTGFQGGIICLLEKHLKRPLQWNICSLHGNELPLRHIFVKMDGHSTGPYTYSGPIGSKLQVCHTFPVAEFERIETEIPDFQSDDLSYDQSYLLDICRAVSTGAVTDQLAP